jgi:hypothetical protein
LLLYLFEEESLFEEGVKDTVLPTGEDGLEEGNYAVPVLVCVDLF